MIIWLASYPRSGNTLLRTILKHCLNLHSYADEPVWQESEFRRNPDLIGHLESDQSWQDFYQIATASSKIYFVKTHRPPIDTQPFIYIVRDGRSAIQSYRKFHRDYNHLDISLVDLIVGNDPYGDWSGHYHKWMERSGVKKMLVRFDDLVRVSDGCLADLAKFLGHNHAVSKWVNPIQELAVHEPNFFNSKSIEFLPNQEWTAGISYLFNLLHRRLMVKLGYMDMQVEDEYENMRIYDMDDVILQLNQIISVLKLTNENLSNICEARNSLINELHVTCEERLQLIERLHER